MIIMLMATLLIMPSWYHVSAASFLNSLRRRTASLIYIGDNIVDLGDERGESSAGIGVGVIGGGGGGGLLNSLVDQDQYAYSNTYNLNNNYGSADSIAYLNNHLSGRLNGQINRNFSSIYNDTYAFYIDKTGDDSRSESESGYYGDDDEARSIMMMIPTGTKSSSSSSSAAGAGITLGQSLFCHGSYVQCILLSSVMGVMIISTIVGNAFVIAAVILERNLQGVANYLIVSLAVADLTVAIMVILLNLIW